MGFFLTIILASTRSRSSRRYNWTKIISLVDLLKLLQRNNNNVIGLSLKTSTMQQQHTSWRNINISKSLPCLQQGHPSERNYFRVIDSPDLRANDPKASSIYLSLTEGQQKQPSNSQWRKHIHCCYLAAATLIKMLMFSWQDLKEKKIIKKCQLIISLRWPCNTMNLSPVWETTFNFEM